MLYYYGAKTGVVDYNGSPLPEAYFAEIEEERNGEYKLIVKYPLSDTDNHLSLLENDLISAPTPQHGKQFFRIKNKVEYLDEVVLTCYHITEDIFIRKVKPLNVITKSCQVALDLLIAGSQTTLTPFTFQSDITDVHTFTTDKEDTLYNLLLDGKHSIVGTWEGEIVRDNYNISIPKERGADRGAVISTHYNLEDYERESDTTGVVTRITGVNDKGLSITVDSPIINALPYINEATFTNNNITDGAEMKIWLERKFSVEKIDKPKVKYTIKAFEVDGQTVHLGDYVTVKSKAHRVDGSFKIVAYKYDALEQVYTEFTFSENAWSGGISRSGLSGAVAEILNVNNSTEEELQRKLDNANAIFDKKQSDLKEEIQQGIVASEVKAEEQIATVNGKISEVQAQANIMDSAIKDADAKASLALSNVTTVTNDLTKVKNDLSSAQTTLQADIDSLETTTNQTITDLNKTKTDLLAQASSMSSLTTRMTDVETTANGTKTTVTQLSKTVNDLTGSVDGVTQSVKTVEDSLDGVYTTLSKIQVGGSNLMTNSGNFKDTSFWFPYASVTSLTLLNNRIRVVTGSSGNPRIANKTLFQLTSVSQEMTVSIEYISVGEVILSSKSSDSLTLFNENGSQAGGTITKVSTTVLDGDRKKTVFNWKTLTSTDTIKSSWLAFAFPINTTNDLINVKVEKGNVSTEWTPSIQDSSIEFANYKQAIDGQLTELKRTTETNANDIQTNKTTIETTVNGIKTDISALQTYVNADGTRTTAMQTYVRDENAKQTTSLRTEVANTYASKAQLTSDVNGLTAKIESIQVGGVNLLKGTSSEWKDVSVSQYAGFIKKLTPTDLPNLKVGDFLTFSFDVNTSSNKKLRARLSFSGANKHYFSDDYVMSGTGRVSVSGQVPSGWTDLILYVDANLTATTITTITTEQYKRAKLELGNIATDYSPAPEDAENYTNTKIAEYKQTVDQNYASLSAQVGTKVNTSTFDQTVSGINLNISNLTNDLNGTKSDFQIVKQTSDMYQRVLGKTEGDVTTNIANMVATSDVIQSTVSKSIEQSTNTNLIFDALKLSKWIKNNDLANVSLVLASSGNQIKIETTGQTTNVNYGFKLPLTTSKFASQEKLSYRILLDVSVVPDAGIVFEIVNNKYAFATFAINPTQTGNNQVFTGTFVSGTETTNVDEYALNVKLVKNGKIYVHQMSIVRGDTPPAKFVDNTNSQLSYATSNLQKVNADLSNVNTDLNKVKTDQVATATQVTQLADSYAIKTLNSAGDVLSSVNLNSGGVKIKGNLIHLDGTTLIDDGIIKNAMIGSLDAGKITTGYLSASRISTDSITADKLKIDSALISKLTADNALINTLTAKSAFITSVKAIDIAGERISGGVISALNGNMKIDLNGSKMSFYNNSTIEFNSPNNVIFRKLNDKTGFIELADDSYGGVYAGIGVTSNNAGIDSQSEGYFAGIRIFRSSSTNDRIDFYGDTVTFNHSFSGAGSLYWNLADYKGYDWNLFEILRTFNAGMKNLGQSYFQELGF